jgi:hypothetical protein
MPLMQPSSFKTINLLLSHHSLEAAKVLFFLLHSNQSIEIPWSLLQAVVVAVLLVVVRPDHDQQHCYHQAPTVNQRLLLQLLSS